MSHPELTALVHRLRQQQPRPKMRWSELVARVRQEQRASESRTVHGSDTGTRMNSSKPRMLRTSDT